MADHLTESQRVLGAAPDIEELTASNGQVIQVRKLSRRDLMRCMRMWGSACNVETWLGMAIVAASVHSIDGKPVPIPQSAESVEAISDVLGPEVLKTVEDWFQARNGEADYSTERALAKN